MMSFKILMLFLILHLTRAAVIVNTTTTVTQDDNLLKKLLQKVEELAKQINDIQQKVPNSCDEALKLSGHSGGVHKIGFPGLLESFPVYCLEDPNRHGGAWIIIGRYINDSLDFNRDWVDFKHGFGDLAGSFFIGMEKLHDLTNSKQHELWIRTEIDDQLVFWKYWLDMKYSNFSISDESESYALNSLGSYTSTLPGITALQVGNKFSTKDVDNDGTKNENCAETRQSLWWWGRECKGLSYIHGYVKIPFLGVKNMLMAIRPLNLKL